MTGQSLEGDRVVQQLPIPLVALVELLDLWNLIDGIPHGEREVRLVGDQLRQRIRFRGREAEHASHVLDGCS